jgi:outer membrane protein
MKRFLLAAFLGVALPLTASAENLTDALKGAYETSGLLDQNRALLRAADEDVAIAVSALRPIVDWAISVERNLSDTGIANQSPTRNATTGFTGLVAQWLLYDGGGRQFRKQAAQETVLATRQSLLSVEQRVLQRAVIAYMNVVGSEENVDLRLNNLRVLQEEQKAAQDRFDVGEVTRTDVALAESRVAEARSELVRARGLLVDAQEEYRAVVGRLPGRLNPTPPFPARPASLDAARAIAARNHPDILQAQRQIATSELLVLATEANLGPTATLDADIGLTNNLRNDNYNETSGIGLSFRQRLYQGGGRNAELRRSMAQRDAQRANLITVQRDVLQAVANAWVGLETAEARLIANNDQVEAAQIAFEGIREEATLGARTTLDVLQAEQNLLDALTDRILAQVDRYIAAYQLLQSQGLLTAERLALPVMIYDPAAYYNQVKQAPSVTSRQGRELDRVLRALGKQ